MALTQVSTGGIKDGQVRTADLADAQITAGKLHADALDHTYTLGAVGSDHYTFTGEGLTGAVNDPSLYLTRGKTYRFINGNSSGAHPFRIQSVAGAGGTEYNTGVTNNAGGGGTTIIFEVPHNAPDVLYYICTSHPAMNGIFYVTGALADGSVTTAKLANDAVTRDKIADDVIASEHFIAGEVDATALATNAVTTAKIADEAVTLAKLPHGTGSTDGKFLRANNGADPSFETVSIPAGTTINNNADNRVITGSGTASTLNGESGLTYNGSVLQINGDGQFTGNDGTANQLKWDKSDDSLYFRNGVKAQFGTGGDLKIYHDGTTNIIEGLNNNMSIRPKTGENGILLRNNAAVELYHDDAKKFETTSYGTKLTGYQSSSSYVGFHVKGHNANHGFGTNHGSGITTYDVNYYSPIPMFSSKTIDHGSSYLSFPSYAGGNYVKFTAPVAGLYQLELLASVEAHDGGDWFAFGWEINTETNNGSSNLMNNDRGVLAVYERAGGDEGMGCHFSTTIWMDTNDYAVLYQQSTAAVRWKGNQYYVRGHLIH